MEIEYTYIYMMVVTDTIQMEPYKMLDLSQPFRNHNYIRIRLQNLFHNLTRDKSRQVLKQVPNILFNWVFS